MKGWNADIKLADRKGPKSCMWRLCCV